MSHRIVFDGQEYESIETMPPAVRAAYEDAISKVRQSSADAAKVLAELGGISPALFSRAHSEHYLRAHQEAKQTAARVLPILLVLLVVGLMTLGAWMWHLTAIGRGQEGDFSIRPWFLMLVVITTIAAIGLAMWMTVNKQEPANEDTPESSPADAGAIPAPTANNAGALRALDGIEHVAARTLQILLGMAAGGVVAGGYWMISNMDPSSRSQGGEVFVGIGVVVALACAAGMYVAIEMRLRK